MAITTADRAVVNEGAPAQVTVNAFNLEGEAAAPSTMHYRIDDVQTGQVIKELTEVPTPAAATAISITPADNVILNPSLREEPRRLTVILDTGTEQQARAQFTYYVKNISYA